MKMSIPGTGYHVHVSVSRLPDGRCFVEGHGARFVSTDDGNTWTDGKGVTWQGPVLIEAKKRQDADEEQPTS